LKKIIVLLIFTLTLTLVGCDSSNQSKEVINKTSFEVIKELKPLTEVSELGNLSIITNDEVGRERISRYLSGMEATEPFDTTGFIDAAVLTPFMNVDARSILVVRFDDTVDPSVIKEKLQNFASHLICVQIKNYEIINVGNYYLFSGISDNAEVVETFSNMSFQRDENISSTTSIDVIVSKITEDTDAKLYGNIRYYDNELSMGELKYTLSKDGEINVDGIEEAFLSFDYDTQETIFIIKGELTDEIITAVEGLDNMFVNMHMSEEPLENTHISRQGNFMIFTNFPNSEEVIKYFNNLELK